MPRPRVLTLGRRVVVWRAAGAEGRRGQTVRQDRQEQRHSPQRQQQQQSARERKEKTSRPLVWVVAPGYELPPPLPGDPSAELWGQEHSQPEAAHQLQPCFSPFSHHHTEEG